MMKIRKFLIVALAAVGFAACSKDDVSRGEDHIYKGTEGNAWFSLNLKPSGTVTKAPHSPDDQQAAEGNEAKVETVRVIFFNGFDANSVVTANIAFDATDPEIGTPGDINSAVPGDGFEVPATSKSLMIIINEPADPNFGSFVQKDVDPFTYADVNAVVTKSVSTITTTTYFMMTNAKGGLEPSNMDGTNKDLILYTTKDAAENNSLTLYVDRVAAKVRVYNDMGPNSNATVSDFGWTLNVTNNMYLPMSKRIKTAQEETANPRFMTGDNYRLGSYREDPNFNHNGWNSDIELESKFPINYHYYTDANLPATWTLSAAFEYCLENTQRAEDNSYGYTTQALIKMKYYPTNMLRPLDVKFSPADGDWIKIGTNGYYTWDSFLAWIGLEIYNKYLHEDPSKYTGKNYIPHINYLSEYLTAIGDASSIITLPEPTSQPHAVDTVQLFQDFKNLVMGSNIQDNKTSAGDWSIYVDGVNYYKVAIKHDDFTDQVNALGEFGVVRNSVYDLRVKSVKGPGYPNVPKPKPGEPDESDKSFLSVEIVINPWNWYTQDVNL